ncbi:ATP-binding protein [Streptomyces sp. KLOTTS4A1]|uniref:ATP-binding protein n=1 Tax=Streptomyces sp. KLOTTS4A1 TaxID=3390996 RepID=UPI0039F5B848
MTTASEVMDVAQRASELRVPAELRSLAEIAGYVRALARRAGLDPAAAYRLRLAVDELATNVVTHGYQGADGEIVVAGSADPDWVRVRIEDRAPPFDPREGRSAPAVGVPPEQRPIGGLGVHLALTSVDTFRYERTDGRNISVLAVRTGSARPADGLSARPADAPSARPGDGPSARP